ncbi:unnamed protein product [Sphagnum jensenii]|uniref:Mitochondrial carrier protein n=1 Tax=Sphagnum jensenii TaxID=128206 RepID=A0ABP0XMN0_9BRYO
MWVVRFTFSTLKALSPWHLDSYSTMTTNKRHVLQGYDPYTSDNLLRGRHKEALQRLRGLTLMIKIGRALLRGSQVHITGGVPTIAQLALSHMEGQGVGPNIAINFRVYKTLKATWVTQRPNTSPIFVILACGRLVGICSSSVRWGRRRVLIYKKGLAGTCKQIIQQEGLLGLYRGIVPEYYKVIPSISIVFMTYEFMKRILQPQSWNGY